MAINEVKGRINLMENEKIGLNLFSFLLTMLAGMEWVAWEWDINAHSKKSNLSIRKYRFY